MDEGLWERNWEYRAGVVEGNVAVGDVRYREMKESKDLGGNSFVERGRYTFPLSWRSTGKRWKWFSG